ncbi:MAG: hypothetical protein RL273_1276 [Bacteroidota bacterium]
MKLTRSREDAVLSGLLGGIGEYLNVDPTIVRIIVVVLFFTITPLPIVPLYIIGMIFVPKAPRTSGRHKQQEKRQRMDRAFKEVKHEKQESSSQTKPIDEEDWSDF